MTSKLTEGEVTWNIPAAGKPISTCYWVSGDLKSGNTPLVAAHGGPGTSHDYLLVLTKLTESHGIPVILYDQIGNGFSTHFPEKNGDTKFWTVELFMEELKHLLGKLDIQDSYDLLGHSWGGMLGASVAIRQPEGLRRLVLASSIAIMKEWVEAGEKLKKGLPQDVQDTIDKHEKEGTTDSEEYQKAISVFYSRHLCRVDPMPEGLVKTFEWMDKDPTVYLTMNGPSEFFVTGPLKDFDISGDLHKISVRTLLTNGRYDGAQDNVTHTFFRHIPKVKWVHFAESSHTAFLEEEDRYLEILADFLTEE